MVKKNGNDKTAYILLKRWLDTVKWLKKTQDYKDRKSIYSTNMTVDQVRVNCAGKKPCSVYQRLSTMRQKSEMVKKNGNDKTAYILLKRWLDTVKWLKKTQDYKDRKSIYSTNITVDQQARVNCAGKKPRSVYQRLSTMRQKSEMVKKNGNDKTAYILLKRWLDTVKWLKKTQDYKDRKSIYSTNMTVDQINEVKTILADLRQKSEIRYEHSSRKHNDAVEKMEVDTDGVDTAKTYAPSSDVSLKLPETPTDDPLYGDSDNFISCNQLYSLSQTNNSRYLIIDVRQKAHYDGSKITFDKCINIPQSEIKPGMNVS
ncbi:uncharacterized protein LOC113561805 isoform X3 [Ooceraea biroi]|uniref:uncharacterized protein LOC113561805 isoform X3 n=2 Tax=Ooceraea biroi TaxID=2015173 RepID=UPI000F098985|nr:uncharacterized protein LOC113561805 isoform X3 [Ooceraea biroi]